MLINRGVFIILFDKAYSTLSVTSSLVVFAGGATPTAAPPTTASLLLNFSGVGGVRVMADEPDYSIQQIAMPS